MNGRWIWLCWREGLKIRQSGDVGRGREGGRSLNVILGRNEHSSWLVGSDLDQWMVFDDKDWKLFVVLTTSVICLMQ